MSKLGDDVASCLFEMMDELEAKKVTHTPEEIETMARLLCEAVHELERNSSAIDVAWKGCAPDAGRLLDALQEKGWKITTPHEFPTVSRKRGKPYKPLSWSIMHDAAPIVPRGEA